MVLCIAHALRLTLISYTYTCIINICVLNVKKNFQLLVWGSLRLAQINIRHVICVLL